MADESPLPQAPSSASSPSKRGYAVAALALLAFIWGLAWPFMKMSLDYAEPFTFAALRAVLSAAILMAAVALSRRPLRPPPLGWTALLGLFQTTGFAGLSFWALASGGAGKTAVLVYTMPFWLLLMAWPLLGEKLRGLQWPAVALGFAGLIMILSPWELSGTASSLLAVGTGVSWAAASVVAKMIHRRHNVDVLSLTAWQMVLGSVPLVVVAFALGVDDPQWSPAFVGLLAYNVLLSNGLAWILWLLVLRTLAAGTSGLATLVNPVLGVLFSWWLLGEQPVAVEAAGMTFIILGIALLTLRGLRAGSKS